MVRLKCEFPQNFFEEEKRCDYTVSVQKKKIWAVELDMLNEFSQICSKHSIPFYICGGTLLGAVRHEGMIPWDDDIDVAMFRKDYDRLCEIGPKEFQHPYFFQTEYTDKGSLRGHIQIRNSETTGILISEVKPKRNFNQGIFLDVFPLDNLPDDEKERAKYLKRSKKLYNKCRKKAYRSIYYKFRLQKNFFMMGYDLFLHLLYKMYPSCPYFDYEKAYEEYELFSRSNNNRDTKDVVWAPFYTEKFIWKRSWFENTVYIPFEFMSLPAPQNYVECLIKQYGDYHKFVIGMSAHGGVVFDSSKSYKEYLK